MSGLVKAGLAVFTGGSSVWIPLAIAAGLGAAVSGAGVWWVMDVQLGHAENATEKAAADLKATTDQRDMQAQDAQRYRVATKQYQSVISDQAAQLTRQRADLDRATQIAEQAQQDQQRATDDLQSQLAAMKAKAHANPDQVRPLGPIVLDVLGGMRKQ